MFSPSSGKLFIARSTNSNSLDNSNNNSDSNSSSDNRNNNSDSNSNADLVTCVVAERIVLLHQLSWDNAEVDTPKELMDVLRPPCMSMETVNSENIPGRRPS